MNILYIQPLFIGTTEIILIGVAALLIFGGKKLPEMMRGLGKGVKEFRSGMSGEDDGQEKNPSADEETQDKAKPAAESEEDAGRTA